MAKHRSGYLFKRNGVFYLQYSIAGKRFSKSLGTKQKKEAEKKRSELMDGLVVADEVKALEAIAGRLNIKRRQLEEVEKAKTPPLLLRDAWDTYEGAGNRPDISPSTMQIYSYYWQGAKNGFLTWLKKEHPDLQQVREITFDIAEEYKTYMTRKRKVTGRTFNAHRAFHVSFFNIIKDKANIAENPWKKIMRKDELSRGRDPLTPEELLRIDATAEGELRIVISFGYYIGARMGDACTMDWGNIDLIGEKVSYTPRKTSRKKPKPIVIDLYPKLKELLLKTPPSNRKNFITPKLADLYLEKGPYAVSAIVQKHFKDCGITTTTEGTGIRRSVARGFHSLRHNFISNLREAGAAQSTTQELAGHSSAATHQLYSHSDETAKRKAIYSLPALDGQTVTEEEDIYMVAAEPIREVVKKLNTKNATKIKKELLALLEH